MTWENGVLTVQGSPVPLTPAEAAILDRLYVHRGEVVSREELSALLGGGGNSVEVYVCKLRAKIEKPLGRRMIHTVRGVGYRLERGI
jgi:DNA-binding response OmpR family regulator